VAASQLKDAIGDGRARLSFGGDRSLNEPGQAQDLLVERFCCPAVSSRQLGEVFSRDKFMRCVHDDFSPVSSYRTVKRMDSFAILCALCVFARNAEQHLAQRRKLRINSRAGALHRRLTC